MLSKEHLRHVLWLMPLLVFVAAESVTGNLLHITPLCIALNVAVYYLLYFGVFVIFRTTRVGWAILSVLLYVLAAAEYFVISFRERPVMIWDVLALRTALTVSSNYKFGLTFALVIAFFVIAGLAYISCRYPLRIKKGWMPKIVWSGATVVFGILLFGVWSPKYQLDVPMWDPIVSFEKEGFFLSTVLSFKSVIPPEPDAYLEAEARDLMKEHGPGKKRGTDMTVQTTPANVICIMNESFADLRLYNGLNGGSFETDKSFLEYFDSLTGAENVQKGNLYVPVFGAMTANSEYEFLTGNSCAFLPQGSVPYQFYVKEGDHSLAKIFKEQGYETIAMHPYPGYNWNRTEAYAAMGFDRFLDQTYYDELGQEMKQDLPRGYMSDRSNYDVILKLLEEKKPGESMFIFNVTMQNHGGFEVEGLESTVHVTSVNGTPCAGEYPKTDQYLTLIRMSDEALREFLQELEKEEEPTMVVLFGDHQPGIEPKFFEEMFGYRWSEVPAELKLKSFETPYMIWTNYDREVPESGNMSAFMLGNEVLETAGIMPTGVFSAAESLQKNYDAVHAMGVLKKDGTFIDSREEGGLGQFFDIRKLHVLQYYEVFGQE